MQPAGPSLVSIVGYKPCPYEKPSLEYESEEGVRKEGSDEEGGFDEVSAAFPEGNRSPRASTDSEKAIIHEKTALSKQER